MYMTPLFQVNTTFSEASLIPAIHLDLPDPSAASISLNTSTQELVMTTRRSTNMWTSRNAAPIAWVSTPGYDVVSIETRARFLDTSADQQYAGITFYGSDGGLPVFTYGLRAWEYPSKFVALQGLGTNIPFTLTAIDRMDMYLKVILIQSTNTFSFYYKASAADAWTFHSSYVFPTVDKSRIGLFYKTGGARKGVGFSYLLIEVCDNM